MKTTAIATALAAVLSLAVPAASAGEYILVGADEHGVASLWLVKQASATAPQVMLEDHVEYDETDEVRAHAVSRFNLYDCATGKVERGAPRYFEPGGEDEIHTYGGGDGEWDAEPKTPAPGSYEAFLLPFACAVMRDDPALQSLPRQSRPFTRADAEKVLAAKGPDALPKRPQWQGMAVSDPESGEFGITSVANEPTREAAEAKLAQQCRDAGWTCASEATRQCIAVAYNESTLVYVPGKGTTEAEALGNAHAACRDGDGDCDNDMVRCP